MHQVPTQLVAKHRVQLAMIMSLVFSKKWYTSGQLLRGGIEFECGVLMSKVSYSGLAQYSRTWAYLNSKWTELPALLTLLRASRRWCDALPS
ncbi:hypothetical protein PG995_014239 [Apiospora arundinis]